MAINYTDLATAVGEFVKKIDAYDAWQSTLDTYYAEHVTAFSSLELDLIDGLEDAYDTFQSNLSRFITLELISYASGVLTDETMLTDELGLGDNTGLAAVLPALRRAMIADAEDFLKSAVTIGSPAYDVANTGSLKLITTAYLDGYNAPARYAVADITYSGELSQLAQDSQTLTLTCTQDSESGSATRGTERFNVTGGATSGPYAKTDEGLGGSNQINVMNSAGTALVPNGTFDSWTTAGPSSWTLESGVLDTDFEEDTAALRETSGLKILTSATVELTQTISENSLTRYRGYALVVMVKKSGTTGIVFVNLLEGAAPQAAVEVDMSTAAAGWNVVSDIFQVPAQIDEDWTIQVITGGTFNGTPTVDDVMIVPLTYVGGVGLVLLNVDEKIIVEDEVSFTLSNDNAGKFQTFFRKAYGVQMPTDAAPTIADSLAVQ